MTAMDPLTFLAAVMDGERLHSLCSRNGARLRADGFHASPAELQAQAEALSSQGRDVWFGAHPLKHRPAKRGEATDIAAVRVLVADLDWFDALAHKATELPTEAEVRTRLAAFAFQPSFVVESGHGIQAWWLLNGEVTPDRGAALMARLHHALKAAGLDVDRKDLASILRVPGSVNFKVPDAPTLVRITQANDNRYLPEYLEKHLPPTPPPTMATATATAALPRPAVNPELPGAVFNGRHTCAEVLAHAGWTPAHADGNGDQHWWRPGKGPGETTSATVYAEDGHATIWSTWATQHYPGVEVRRPYDAFGLFAHLFHAGDFKEASSKLEGLGIGSKGRQPLDSIPSSAAAPAPTGASASAIALPPDFWQARPALTQIRQAAHARQRSADAVLHVVLARIAAAVSHTLQLPATVGSPAPLCFFTVILAPPGVGKGNANAIAAELLPLPPSVSQVPLGSGEGLVELLFEWVTEDDGGTGKKVKKKTQTKHQAFVYVDEGQALAELGRRSGSTLMPTLRSIWSGGMIGNANAAQENKRIVPAGQYTFGVVVGLQDSKAGPLLDDADGGTPQRFGWASATAPDLPDTPPAWPGALAWVPPGPLGLEQLQTTTSSGYRRHEIGVAPEIRAEILAADLARQRGQLVVAELDAHSDLLRLKVAALLALLDHRLDVNAEDWHLAGVMKATSDAVRSRAAFVVGADAQRQEQSTVVKVANRAAESDAAVRRRRIVDCAKAIARKVHAEPERWTVAELRRSMRLWREELEDGVAHATAEGWVVEVPEPGQGPGKRSLRPGPKATV